jgi:transposase
MRSLVCIYSHPSCATLWSVPKIPASRFHEYASTWVSRVPETLSEAKQITQYTGLLEDLESGYQGKEFKSEYGEVKQRWLLVYSEQAYTREEKTLKRQVAKENKEKTRELNRWLRTDFDCENDAKEAVLRWSRKLKYHCLGEIEIMAKKVHQGKGRPKEGTPVTYRYRVKTLLKEDQTKIDSILRTKGRFIIATNELDETLLTSKELLQNYKGQQSVERGFRFLKEPAFMTPAVYLKSQKRIIALAMVMCLCLLVYTIAQRYLRQRLEQAKACVPNQLGKATRTPTMRWIFQLFEGVHLLIRETQDKIEEIILNMNPVRSRVLAILGPPFEKIYANG